ncbi:hypothetical protein EIN_058660 [Entamoeba invadens IP1]|uniref:hypothetical protein n=1 Tax=Entamoeba invadens IP1 TaxID=370355 RepID=UPI0002C3D771|nr:hypothetical protein EIN_058660 [Entamoeba invadens IP1]ELP93411.1 hypothetical protein EIN_058660 [Entamoeba invadens IP1]|eukprot:XP_004260182.1 hypothetical protein EIN_058660 [Entamoeba invadens IP1]
MNFLIEEIHNIQRVLGNEETLQLTPPTVMLLNGLSHPEFTCLFDIKRSLDNMKKLIIDQGIDQNSGDNVQNSDVLLLEFCQYCELNSLVVKSLGGNIDLTQPYLSDYLTDLEVNNTVVQSISLMMNIPTNSWKRLEVLKITGCGISELENIFNSVVFPNLQRVDVSRNRISKLSGLDERPLDAFTADFNRIESVYFNPDNIPFLSYLSLNNNKLSDINSLAPCKNLSVLGLMNNNISSTASLSSMLGSLIVLNSLFLTGNPICSIQNYRFNVIKYLNKSLFEPVTGIDENGVTRTYDADVDFALDGIPLTQKDIVLIRDSKSFPESSYRRMKKDDDDLLTQNTSLSMVDERLGLYYQNTSIAQTASFDESTGLNLLDKLIALDVKRAENDDSPFLSVSFDGKLKAFDTSDETFEMSKSGDVRSEMEKQTERMETIEYGKSIVNIVSHRTNHDSRDVNNAERVLRKIKGILRLDDAASAEVRKAVNQIEMQPNGALPGDRQDLDSYSQIISNEQALKGTLFEEFEKLITKFNNNNRTVEVVIPKHRSDENFTLEIILPFEVPYIFDLIQSLVLDKDEYAKGIVLDFDKIKSFGNKYFEQVERNKSTFGESELGEITSKINKRIFNCIIQGENDVIENNDPVLTDCEDLEKRF